MTASRMFRILLFALIAMPILMGCESDPGQRTSNQAPFVQFTGGPARLEASGGYYSIEVQWFAWDYDGKITRFEYALDPNPDPLNPIFSLEEINYPEENLGRPVRILRGAEDATDTLLYGKTVDGKEYTYRWIQTREFTQILNLATPSPVQDTSQARLGDFQYEGKHTLFVRAFDNLGAVSVMDYLSTEITEAEGGYTVLNMAP